MRPYEEDITGPILTALRAQEEFGGVAELIIWAVMIAGSENLPLFGQVVLGFCEAVKKP